MTDAVLERLLERTGRARRRGSRSSRAALPLAQALAAGGLPVAEVTFRTPVAAEAIRLLAAETELLVGAGTVVRAEQVDVAVAGRAPASSSRPASARRWCAAARELGVPVMPGVATATEVIAALEHGLSAV